MPSTLLFFLIRVKRCPQAAPSGPLYLKKDPDISEQMIHQAGFMVCTICKAVLVTTRRNHCTSCTSSCRTSCSSNKSSCSEPSPDPVASPGHSVSPQVSLVSSSPMSPAQEVLLVMGGGRSSREPVVDTQVRENTLPGLISLGLPESDPPIVSTDPPPSLVVQHLHAQTQLPVIAPAPEQGSFPSSNHSCSQSTSEGPIRPPPELPPQDIPYLLLHKHTVLTQPPPHFLHHSVPLLPYPQVRF